MLEKPPEVVIVGVLALVSGILGVVYALIGFLSGSTTGFGIGTLAVSLVIASVYLLLARGLFGGNALSRRIVLIASTIGLIAGFFGLFINASSGIVQMLWSAAIIALLITPRARAYFSGAYPPRNGVS